MLQAAQLPPNTELHDLLGVHSLTLPYPTHHKIGKKKMSEDPLDTTKLMICRSYSWTWSEWQHGVTFFFWGKSMITFWYFLKLLLADWDYIIIGLFWDLFSNIWWNAVEACGEHRLVSWCRISHHPIPQNNMLFLDWRMVFEVPMWQKCSKPPWPNGHRNSTKWLQMIEIRHRS